MIVKYIGRDDELSTTGVDHRGDSIGSWDVTRAVLNEIGTAFAEHGLATWSNGSGYALAASSDCLRHWAPNGACFYADMSHVEACTPETASPFEYAAHCLSTLQVVEAARRRAERRAPPGTRYELATANVDALDPAISWGTHVNLSVESEVWETLLEDPRYPSVLGFVSTAIGAAVAFFGAGYVLPLKDGRCTYSLSGRAHHLSRVSTYATTRAFERGLLNSRREPHADGLDRLHLIGFDFCLIGAALQAAFVQCILAAAEEGYGGLSAFDPVRATRLWSWGLDTSRGRFTAQAQMTDGRTLALPAYVGELAGVLLEMCDSGLIPEEKAPGARELLPRIVHLAEHAAAGRVVECARHLDWAAKLLVLLDVARGEGGGLESAAVRLADHDFGSTDPERGAFWRLWEAGRVDPLVTREEVARCLTDGPETGRGWARGRLIQRFARDISAIDWDEVELRLSDDLWGRRLKVAMPRPDGHCRETFGPILERARDVAELAELLDGAVGASQTDPVVEVREHVRTP